MKRILFTLLLIFQVGFLMAHGRPQFVAMQQKQESTIEAAFKEGKVTENEYKKLMREQKYIKESIELAELDTHWTLLEHNTLVEKLQRAEKKIRKYMRNNEKF